MSATETIDSIDECEQGETLRADCFRLFVLGLSARDIADRVGCTSRSIDGWITRYDWQLKRSQIHDDRERRMGKDVLKEQEKIKGEERAYAIELMACASQAIREFDPKKCKPEAIVKMLELASKLSRLSVGLPLTSVEVTVQHNLDEEFKSMIDKVYAAKKLPPSAPIEIEGKVNVSLGQDAPG